MALSNLPHFDAPPIVETVMGVFFRPLEQFSIAERAGFWGRFRSEFPNIEERPPIDEVKESLPLRNVRNIQWQVSNTLPSPRIWAKSTDLKHTMQIQQNALMVNWERDASIAYWGYDERRDDFASKLRSLESYMQEMSIGDVSATSAFLTYINHIEYLEGLDFEAMLQRTLVDWQGTVQSEAWPLKLERANMDLGFALPDKSGVLQVKLVPAFRTQDNVPVLRLDLTARGEPAEDSIEATLNWIDLAHAWIVRGFATLTRPEMHELWSRKR